MGRAHIETVQKLLAKAQSTASEAEALALVERSYELLARVINDHDEANPDGAARRRERRRLRDRRRRARAESAAAQPAPGADPIARYRAATGRGEGHRRGVDVSL
ncbi:MAG TPA: DUF2786 domain-containing protein [Acidimicrobiales bacterium]|nr:DUF2786 domain-containing protein [Acidimicrobiales bacterium]